MSNVEHLTTDRLRLQVEKLHIEHIKLCQDNFLYFVQEMWQDFICRKEKNKNKWGHHQIIASDRAARIDGLLAASVPRR